jgi:ADP-ribose pyrophosphatase
MALAEGRFLRFKMLRWTDAKGVDRLWETVDRLGGRRAVVIVPRLVPSGRLILIRQFRPPARGVVVEFPAGLIDGDESPAAAARRELAEETGYIANRLGGGLPAFSSPGMSDETIHFFRADIDETAPENQNPKTNFDSGEMIETLFVPTTDLMAFCESEHAKGVLLDAKILSVAAAFSLL